MKSTFKNRYLRLMALLAAGAIAAIGAAGPGNSQEDNDRLDQLAQWAELEQLHAAFHAAVSVHDLSLPAEPDEVLTQRIRDAVALWTHDGEITVVSSAPTAGNYIGYGDPDDPLTCPQPSYDTSATGRQGTLCTFFKWVSGGMQSGNKWVSLSPAYKTKFAPVKEHGQWKSSVYFECHYFDVSLNPATGQPFWTAKSHVDLDGEAKKIDGRWLFTHVSSSAVSVPVP